MPEGWGLGGCPACSQLQRRAARVSDRRSERGRHVRRVPRARVGEPTPRCYQENTHNYNNNKTHHCDLHRRTLQTQHTPLSLFTTTHNTLQQHNCLFHRHGYHYKILFPNNIFYNFVSQATCGAVSSVYVCSQTPVD